MKKSLMKSTSGVGLAGLLICGAFLTQNVQADEIKPAVSETNEGVTANTAETNSATATPLAPVKPTETTETAEVSKLKAEVADLEKQVSETETAHKVAAETTATAQKELDDQKESNQQAQAEIDKRNKEVEELQKADQEKSAASYKDYLEYLGKNTQNRIIKEDIANALEVYKEAEKTDGFVVNNKEGNPGNINETIKAVQIIKDINTYRKAAGISEMYVDPIMAVGSQIHHLYQGEGHIPELKYVRKLMIAGQPSENISSNAYVKDVAARWYEEKKIYDEVAPRYGLTTDNSKLKTDDFFDGNGNYLVDPMLYKSTGHYLNMMFNDQNLVSVSRSYNPNDSVGAGDSLANFGNTKYVDKYLASGRIMTVADYEKSLKDFAEQFQAQKPNQAKIAQLQAEIKDFQARIKDLADLNKKLSDAQTKENELAGQLQELRQKQEQAKAKLKTAETPKQFVTFTEEEKQSIVYHATRYLNLEGVPYYKEPSYSAERVRELYNKAVKVTEHTKNIVTKTPNLSQKEKEAKYKEIDVDLRVYKKVIDTGRIDIFSENIYWNGAHIDKYRAQARKAPSKEQTLKEIQSNTILSASSKLFLTEEMMDYYNGPVYTKHANGIGSITPYEIDYHAASQLANLQAIWNKYLTAQAKGQTVSYTYQPVKDIQEVKVRYVEQRYEASADGLGKYFKVSLAPDEKRTLDLNDYAEVLKGAKLIDGYRLGLHLGYNAVDIQDGTVTYLYEPLRKDTPNIVPPKVNVKYVALDTDGKELYSTELPVQFTRNDISTFGRGIIERSDYWDYAGIKKSELENGSYILGLGKNNPLPRQITKDGKVYYQDTGHEAQRDGDQNKVVYKYVLIGNESALPKAEVTPEQPTQPVSPTQPVEQPTRPSLRQRSLLDPVTGVSIFGSSDALAGVVRANIVVAATNVFGGQAYNAYDITLLNGNLEAVQPKGKITVSLPTNGLEVDQVFHVTRDNQLEPLAFTVHQNIVTFETDHFSIYAVTYKTGQRVPERGTVSNLVSFTGSRSEVVQTATTAPAQTENKTTTVKNLPNTGETSNGFLALLGLVAGIFGIRVFTKKQD